MPSAFEASQNGMLPLSSNFSQMVVVRYAPGPSSLIDWQGLSYVQDAGKGYSHWVCLIERHLLYTAPYVSPRASSEASTKNSGLAQSLGLNGS